MISKLDEYYLLLDSDVEHMSASELVDYLENLEELLTMTAWNENMFASTKMSVDELGFVGVAWARIQESRSRSKAWMNSLPSLVTDDAVDPCDQQVVATMLEQDSIEPESSPLTDRPPSRLMDMYSDAKWRISNETLRIIEWQNFEKLHKLYKDHPDFHVLITARIAVGCSLVRFMRFLFYNQQPVSNLIPESRIETVSADLLGFGKHFMAKVEMTNREMKGLKSVLYGSRTMLGDFSALRYTNADFFTRPDPKNVIIKLTPTSVQDVLIPAIEGLRGTSGELTIGVAKLDGWMRELVILIMIRIALFRYSSNAFDLFQYVVFWHEWLTENAFREKLMRGDTLMKSSFVDPATITPVMCSVGNGAWKLLFKGVSYSFSSAMDCLAGWWIIVKEKQSGISDRYAKVPDVDFTASRLATVVDSVLVTNIVPDILAELKAAAQQPTETEPPPSALPEEAKRSDRSPSAAVDQRRIWRISSIFQQSTQKTAKPPPVPVVSSLRPAEPDSSDSSESPSVVSSNSSSVSSASPLSANLRAPTRHRMSAPKRNIPMATLVDESTEERIE